MLRIMEAREWAVCDPLLRDREVLMFHHDRLLGLLAPREVLRRQEMWRYFLSERRAAEDLVEVAKVGLIRLPID